MIRPSLPVRGTVAQLARVLGRQPDADELRLVEVLVAQRDRDTAEADLPDRVDDDVEARLERRLLLGVDERFVEEEEVVAVARQLAQRLRRLAARRRSRPVRTDGRDERHRRTG